MLNNFNLTATSQAPPPQDRSSSPYMQTCLIDDLEASPDLSSFDPRQMTLAQSKPASYFAQSTLAQELSNKLTSPPLEPASKPYVTIASLTETQQLQQKKPVATVLPNVLIAPVEPRDTINKSCLSENLISEGENKCGDLRPSSPAYLQQQNLATDGPTKVVDDDFSQVRLVL